MGDTERVDAPKPAFKFIRGTEGDAGDCEWPDGAETVRKAIAESLNAKNVAFLLGAGCSSSQTGGTEVGIPTMAPLAKEFTQVQSRVVREQSVLFTMGYAFADEHINNIIYQALTIPTFRLVIFVNPELDGEIAKLRTLNDPRIWIIGGDGPQTGRKAHYFDTIIDEFMPQRPSERIDEAVKKVLEAMSPRKERSASDDEEAGE